MAGGLDAADDDVEIARRLIVMFDQSYARTGHNWSSPCLLRDRRARWQPGTWENLPAKVVAAATRLRGVALEHADAIPMLARWDLPDTLIYCDPPYVGEQRIDPRHGYRRDVGDWHDLVDALLSIEHAVVLLSGYPCAEAERLTLAGWHQLDLSRRRHAGVSAGNGGGRAPETLWLNHEPAGRLFGSMVEAVAK